MRLTSRLASMTLASAAVAAIAPFSAFAASGDGSRTEFFWQPMANRAAARLDLGMNQKKFDSDSTTSVKGTSTTGMLTGQYAIDDSWAFGLMLGYLTGKTEASALGQTVSTDRSGLQDVALTAQSLRPMGAFTLAYGARLYIAPGNVKNNATTSLPENATSGGHSLAPYVGGSYELMAGQFVGGQVEYRHRFEAKAESGGTTTSQTGGHNTTASLFYQYKTDMFSVFPIIRYVMTDAVSIEKADGIERNSGWEFGLNAAYYATSDISVLANYAHGMTGDYKWSGSNIKNTSNDTFMLAGRFEF